MMRIGDGVILARVVILPTISSIARRVGVVVGVIIPVVMDEDGGEVLRGFP